MVTSTIRTLLASMWLSLVAFATPAASQMFPPQAGDLVAEISFDFLLGAETAPAGEYLLRVQADGSTLLCEDGVYCRTTRGAISASRAGYGRAAVLRFVETPAGPRFAGLGSNAIDPCHRDRLVASRPLRVHDNAGTELAMAWR